MKYLVTGGLGFIGTNLCLRLLKNKNEVVVLDNLSTGMQENLKLLLSFDGFEFIWHDIIYEFPKDLNDIDFVYNLACPASPAKYLKDPFQTFRSSVWGVWNCINFIKKHNIGMLHTSTSEIYGNPLVTPQSESYNGNVNCIGPRACYDEGKRAAECLISDFNRTRKGTESKAKIVRIFNTYGPFMAPDDGRVISNFIVKGLTMSLIHVYGSGDQTRSFCYIDDLIDGLIAMEKKNDFNGPINLGNPNEELSILELAKKVKQFLNNENIIIEFAELPQDDPERRKPDITLAKKVLNWEPVISLDEGLPRTISYFKRLLNVNIDK